MVNQLDHEISPPDVSEAELNEFCETSSWETSSALSDNDERQSSELLGLGRQQ